MTVVVKETDCIQDLEYTRKVDPCEGAHLRGYSDRIGWTMLQRVPSQVQPSRSLVQHKT
jgi:hypothetical protein